MVIIIYIINGGAAACLFTFLVARQLLRAQKSTVTHLSSSVLTTWHQFRYGIFVCISSTNQLISSIVYY